MICFLAAPSASPGTVTHASETNTSLTFEWSRVPCGQRGGPNDFYYKLSALDGSLIYNDSTPNLSATIVGLDSCNIYRFVVMAFNDAGDGDPSEPVEGETGIGGKRLTLLVVILFCFAFVLEKPSVPSCYKKIIIC